jgi:ribosomal protein S27E
MNFISKYIQIKLGWICPICYEMLYVWRGCSHTPMKSYCKQCDYEKVYIGKSASGVSFQIETRCKICGKYLWRNMHAGVIKDYCPECDSI